MEAWCQIHPLPNGAGKDTVACAYDSSSNLWQCMTDAVSGQLADSVRLMMSCCLLAPVALNIAEPVSRPRELCIAAAALSPPQGASPRLLDVFIASFRKGAQGRSFFNSIFCSVV